LAQKKPEESFRVIDRRLFDAQGHIREEADREEERQEEKSEPRLVGTPPGMPSPAASPAAGPQPVSPADETPDRKPSRGLQMLINFLAQNAAMLLGAYPDPRTGQAMIDLEGARELIDMLDALRETTRGNLAAEDDRLLLDVLGSLKLSYMETTKAAAKAMKDKAQARP
jgi:Domain of unknown function (DUF1844)